MTVNNNMNPKKLYSFALEKECMVPGGGGESRDKATGVEYQSREVEDVTEKLIKFVVFVGI